MVSTLDMRRVIIALILLLLILTPLIAQTDRGKPNEAQTDRAPNVPRTVDEAVSVLKTRGYPQEIWIGFSAILKSKR
jgi:hypothetical protein